MNNLWELADLFEDRSKDREKYSPVSRMIWRQALEELTSRLGERSLP